MGLFNRWTERRDKRIAEAADRVKQATRPSDFIAERKSDTETVFTLAKVATITAHTDRETRQVSIAWEFVGSPEMRVIAFFFTSSPNAIERAEKKVRRILLGKEMPDQEIALEFNIASQVAAAMREGGPFAAAQWDLQPFAPTSTSLKNHVELVFPEGLWYVRVHLATGSAQDAFVYTVNLDKTVREAARQEVKKPVAVSAAQSVIDQLKGIADSVQNIKDALGELTLLDDQIETDAKLSSDDKRRLKHEVQIKRESLIRQLRK